MDSLWNGHLRAEQVYPCHPSPAHGPFELSDEFWRIHCGALGTAQRNALPIKQLEFDLNPHAKAVQAVNDQLPGPGIAVDQDLIALAAAPNAHPSVHLALRLKNECPARLPRLQVGDILRYLPLQKGHCVSAEGPNHVFGQLHRSHRPFER
ncbi:unannotated protein [freshwater metagenome]|uniref:Unannotated protein n=1 Tax=freshwater metagenome TaxID=449393 RepID=A0A6J6UVZ0_9ZZZZ